MPTGYLVSLGGNNALNGGDTIGGGTVVTLKEADWRRIFDINVPGTVNWMKAVLPTMIGQGRGAATMA